MMDCSPVDVYVSDPYCGPVVWNGRKERGILKCCIRGSIDYLELYNVTDSLLNDLLQIAPDGQIKRTDGAAPPALPSSVHRYIYSVFKHTTSSLWWRFKEWLYHTSVNVFHFVDTGSSLISTSYTIADYYKNSNAAKSCSSIARLVAKNGSLLLPPEQGDTSDPSNPAYFYAYIKSHTSNSGKCDTKASKDALQAAVENAFNEIYDTEAVAACMCIGNSEAWYVEMRLVYINHKSRIAFSNIDCEPA